MTRVVIAALTAGLLAGCSGTAAVVAGGASLATFINTDKFVTDHVASAATGMDCSSLNVTTKQGAYCKAYQDPKAAALAAEQNYPFCYRTLGAITCYDQPDPFQNNEDPVR